MRFVDFPRLVKEERNSRRKNRIEEWARRLDRILGYFREPDEETVEKILKERLGVKENDESYGLLKTTLFKLIGRRTREKEFLRFFEDLSSQLCTKLKRKIEESEGKARREASLELEMQLLKSREQITTEVMLRAFSMKILTISDRSTYLVLKLLFEGEKCREHLKRTSNLRNNELNPIISYLKDLNLVTIRYSGDESYALTSTGRTILEKRGTDFESAVDLLGDKIHQLSLKAVGGDKMMAEKLESLMRNGRLRGHRVLIEKLDREFGGDYRKISQVIFDMREMGDRHEKHFGLKIVDHQASGELLKRLSAESD